jgi:hypothetical protein
MKTRVMIFVVSSLVVASATARAQAVIRGTESSDQSTSTSRVTILTPDREIVPLVKETRTTKETEGTQRSESVTRVRLNDGSYFDWQRSTTVRQEVAPGVTQVSRDVVEKDRQGGDRMIQRSVETVTRTDQGEKVQSKVYTRNSSGQLVLDHAVEATTIQEAGGQALTTRIEQVADVNGNLVPKSRTEETTTKPGANETVTTATKKTVNHLTGQLGATEQTTTSTLADGATKEIDSVVRTPGRMGWEVTGRTVTTEKTAANGSVTRQTVEWGRSLYSTSTGNELLEPLVPQRKVVEQETRQPNGVTVVQRDVFLRDVNGDWRPESFSTNQPTLGDRNTSYGYKHQP